MALRSQFGGVTAGPHTADLSIVVAAEDSGRIISGQRHDAVNVAPAHHVDIAVDGGLNFFGREHGWTPVCYAMCRTICTILITSGRGNELR
jgi:hypothetical protein